jgi:hypothetical protein
MYGTMMTKKEFANLVIDKFCYDTGINRNELKESDIFKSSCLAVAMEYLNMLPDNLKEYSSERGGVLFTNVDIENNNFVSCLTVRELLELLPD